MSPPEQTCGIGELAGEICGGARLIKIGAAERSEGVRARRREMAELSRGNFGDIEGERRCSRRWKRGTPMVEIDNLTSPFHFYGGDASMFVVR